MLRARVRRHPPQRAGLCRGCNVSLRLIVLRFNDFNQATAMALKSYMHFTLGLIKRFFAESSEPDTKNL